MLVTGDNVGQLILLGLDGKKVSNLERTFYDSHVTKHIVC